MLDRLVDFLVNTPGPVEIFRARRDRIEAQEAERGGYEVDPFDSFADRMRAMRDPRDQARYDWWDHVGRWQETARLEKQDRNPQYYGEWEGLDSHREC